MAVCVVTDSTADLTPAERERWGVDVVPLTVFFGEEALLDGVQVTSEEFFARLPQANPLPRTSQPTAAQFVEVYRRLLDAGHEVVSVHISSRLSGTLNSARAAVETLTAQDRVTLVDSLSVTAGLALAVQAAAKAAAAGCARRDTADAARNALQREHVQIVVDTLEYLRRGGRIGRARSLLGGLLAIKPIITLHDGEVAPLERVRTRPRAIERLFELASRYQNAAAIRIIHSALPQEAQRLADRLAVVLPKAEISVTWIGPVVGVYTGPGSLGAVVLTAP